MVFDIGFFFFFQLAVIVPWINLIGYNTATVKADIGLFFF